MYLEVFGTRQRKIIQTLVSRDNCRETNDLTAHISNAGALRDSWQCSLHPLISLKAPFARMYIRAFMVRKWETKTHSANLHSLSTKNIHEYYNTESQNPRTQKSPKMILNSLHPGEPTWPTYQKDLTDRYGDLISFTCTSSIGPYFS